MSYDEERELLSLVRENNILLKRLIEITLNNNGYDKELAINLIANMIVRG